MRSYDSNRTTVVGVFHDLRHAQAAVKELRAAGFREDQIGIVAHDQDGGAATGATRHDERGSKVGEGAAAGAATGAGVGALWAIGIAAGLLPAIGPIVAGGILGSILASAAGAAAVGGLAGALAGLGIPDEEAEYYEGEFRSGRTLVTVKTADRQAEAWTILSRHDAYDVEGGRTAGAAATARTTTSDVTANRTATGTAGVTGAARATAARAGADKTVQLREEQLRTEKATQQVGEVRVRKEVVTEHKTIDVPVTREEVVIERHAVPGTRAGGPVGRDEEIRIPVKEEQVRVTKTPVVKEEVTVGKRTVTENRHVEADVKSEKLRVDETGDAHVQGGNRPR